MSELHPVNLCSGSAKVDVVFVHGLEGDWRDTWATDPACPETFWPGWAVEHLPDANFWALEYEAKRSNWRPTMSLLQHADQVLELLLTEGLGERPIIFVAHSLGGLLVKGLLRASCDASDVNGRKIAKATRGVAFFATPNSGSHLALASNGQPVDPRTIQNGNIYETREN